MFLRTKQITEPNERNPKNPKNTEYTSLGGEFNYHSRHLLILCTYVGFIFVRGNTIGNANKKQKKKLFSYCLHFMVIRIFVYSLFILRLPLLTRVSSENLWRRTARRSNSTRNCVFVMIGPIAHWTHTWVTWAIKLHRTNYWADVAALYIHWSCLLAASGVERAVLGSSSFTRSAYFHAFSPQFCPFSLVDIRSPGINHTGRAPAQTGYSRRIEVGAALEHVSLYNCLW